MNGTFKFPEQPLYPVQQGAPTYYSNWYWWPPQPPRTPHKCPVCEGVGVLWS